MPIDRLKKEGKKDEKISCMVVGGWYFGFVLLTRNQRLDTKTIC